MHPTIPNRFRSGAIAARFSGAEDIPDIDPADAARLIEACEAAEAQAKLAALALDHVQAQHLPHAEFGKLLEAGRHINTCIQTIHEGRTGGAS